MKQLTSFAFATLALALSLSAQSPAPVVVQAVPAAQAAASNPAPAGQAAPAPAAAVLSTLAQIKAANDEVLSKQAATLQQLEEIEKAAEQIKIYTKRG
jgi:Skp family chaperone for outer membrane proteins